MSMRNIAVIGVIAMLIIAYVAWTRNTQTPAAGPMASQQQAAGEAPQGDAGAPPSGDASQPPQQVEPMIETGTNPGLAWHVPGGWTDRNTSSMRLATYVIPGPNDTEATCAVYYFGPGQGGPVDANLARWQGEFKEAKDVTRTQLEAHDGVAVTRVSATGTYLAHVGMMGEGSSQEMRDWALLGAIAEGPNGSVFFKLTGPAATVQRISGDFEKMLKSIHKA